MNANEQYENKTYFDPYYSTLTTQSKTKIFQK